MHLFLTLLTAAVALAQDAAPGRTSPQEFYKQGHSLHGSAFDEGPRQKPWVMEGIGKTHFAITASNPEVQKWFDQGNTLLHSFWYYEAERSFRWAIKLDKECAMCYWGLARSAGDRERSAAFMKEAVKRKDKVSERERLYIEAGEQNYKDPEPGEDREARRQESRRLMERIVLKYPGDIEARSLVGLENMFNNRVGTEAILRQVLEKDPNHPGAHHYRIHNWDGKEGDFALDSCRIYGRLAPQIGHAQHMPGHVYSGIGMWHEGAISMDAATRVEKRYMKERMIFPFNNWNYAHNRNYLAYIQEQLGMAEAALQGARDIVAAPLDPKYNKADQPYGSRWQGMIMLLRAMVKFERWKEILDGKSIPWGEATRDKAYKAHVETLAHLGQGNLEKAAKSFQAHSGLKGDVEKAKDRTLEDTYKAHALEAEGLYLLAKGEALRGLAKLAEAAAQEEKLRREQNDPPFSLRPLYNVLGRAYLREKSPALAAAAFEKTLETVRNDGFALAGLVEAHMALGQRDKAEDAYARLLFVWSDADKGLPWLERAQAFGLTVKPKDTSPGAQRNYRMTALEHLGPNVWEPYEAPALDAVDSKGQKVTLADFKGKNVILIFYLGEECVHCLEQLAQAGKKKADFLRLNTEILAISSATPEANTASLKMGEVPVRLLSDKNFENARRFLSYDDFEEKELHSTILIDRNGRVHWARSGGDPFTDWDFLTKEIRRMSAPSGTGGGN